MEGNFLKFDDRPLGGSHRATVHSSDAKYSAQAERAPLRAKLRLALKNWQTVSLSLVTVPHKDLRKTA